MAERPQEDKLKSPPSFKAAGLAVNWTSKPGPPSRSSSRKQQGDSKPEGQEGEGGSVPLSPSRYAESFFRTGSNSGVSRTSSLLSRTSSAGRASPRMDPTHGDVLAALAPISDEEPPSATASGSLGQQPAPPARSDSMSQAFAAYAAPPPVSVKAPDPAPPRRSLSPPRDARGAGARVKTAVEPRPLPRDWAGWSSDGKLTELATRLALIEAKVVQVDEGIDFICETLQQLAGSIHEQGKWHHRQWREHDRRSSEQFASLQARLDQHFAALELKQETVAAGLQARQDAMFQQLEASRKEAAQAQDAEHKRAWADQHSRQDTHFAALGNAVSGHLDIIKASFDEKLDAVKAAHAEESRTMRQYLQEVKGKSTEVVEGQVGLENSTRIQFKQTTDTLEMMMKQMMEELRQSVINLRRTVRRH